MIGSPMEVKWNVICATTTATPALRETHDGRSHRAGCWARPDLGPHLFVCFETKFDGRARFTFGSVGLVHLDLGAFLLGQVWVAVQDRKL